MLKGQKGITLVALVITIIVMLILAGVSISLVVGNNGVLTQAEGAVSTTDLAAFKEKVSLAITSAEMEYLANIATNTAAAKTDAEAAGFLDGQFDKLGTLSATVGDATTTVNITAAGTTYKVEGLVISASGSSVSFLGTTGLKVTLV